MADHQNNVKEHKMTTSQTTQGLTTPELITLTARKNDLRFGIYMEWAGILLIAGILSRFFMTYAFDACVSYWVKDGHLLIKDVWNMMMYAVPLIFVALSGGLAIAGGLYAVLSLLETKRQIFFLKRKIRKLALQARREEADVRP
ncbi:conjugal transfer protein TrbF [Enterobacter cloacae]